MNACRWYMYYKKNEKKLIYMVRHHNIDTIPNLIILCNMSIFNDDNLKNCFGGFFKIKICAVLVFE